MKYKDIKRGAKVYHVDFPEEIGEITDIDSEHYFMIEYANKPKSILMNPYQAEYSELRYFKLVK